MIVPSEAPKSKTIVINKKLYYLGAFMIWIGAPYALASTYAHFKMFEQGIFTPEILLNKALLIGSLVIALVGFNLMCMAKGLKLNHRSAEEYIIRSNDSGDAK